MLLKFSDNCCSNVAHCSTTLAFYLALLTMRSNLAALFIVVMLRKEVLYS